VDERAGFLRRIKISSRKDKGQGPTPVEKINTKSEYWKLYLPPRQHKASIVPAVVFAQKGL